MIEVFITDIQTKIQAEILSSIFQNENADLKIKIYPDKILATVRSQGFNCEILEDKVCIQKEKL